MSARPIAVDAGAGGNMYAQPQAVRYPQLLIPTIVALVAAAGARAHEFVPLVAKLHPVLLLAYGIAPLLLLSSSRRVLDGALRTRSLRLFVALVVWAAIGAPFGIWMAASIKSLQAFVPDFVLITLILVAPATVRTIDRLQAGIVLACALTGLQALLAGQGASEGRLGTGGSLDPNDLATVTAMAVPLALGLFMRARGVWRLLWLPVIGLLLAVYSATGSRGGTIALVVATVVLVAGQPGKRRLVLAGICVVAGMLTWSFGPATLRERVTSFVRGEHDYNETDYTGRKAIWARARGYIAERPVFGVGVTNFPFMEGETCKRLFPGRGCKWSAAHNSYLQATTELGIPGGLLFIALLGSGFVDAFGLWRAAPRRREDRMHRPEFLASLAGFAAGATFLSLAYLHLTFALLGLVALAYRTRMLDAGAIPAARAVPQPHADPVAIPVRTPRRRGGLAIGRFHPHT